VKDEMGTRGLIGVKYNNKICGIKNLDKLNFQDNKF